MPYRDPNTPTTPGWYLCEVPETMDRGVRWACIEVVDCGRLQALHFGSYRDLDFPHRWGRAVDMDEPVPVQ